MIPPSACPDIPALLQTFPGTCSTSQPRAGSPVTEGWNGGSAQHDSESHKRKTSKGPGAPGRSCCSYRKAGSKGADPGDSLNPPGTSGLGLTQRRRDTEATHLRRAACTIWKLNRELWVPERALLSAKERMNHARGIPSYGLRGAPGLPGLGLTLLSFSQSPFRPSLRS